ncbi:PGF-pre-PGF domain-containing protein [Methanomethylovorans sp.]|uniref:PGF-pre-PGF domain-containing protein n=1 Tax=Methanomethylovorans sp. TaxID=2758717 RepID=UPI000A483FF0|nr:PGF-pre-PGF domain-containing protein [Methanomethylovorans sp.]
MRTKLDRLLYLVIGLVYFGTVLSFMMIPVEADLVDNVTVDRTALSSAISDASSKATNSAAGIEIGQYPQASIKAFNDAINKARAVLNDPGATQTQVNRAIADLKDAEATFEAAKITTIDKTLLVSAINAASLKITGAVAGIEIGQYPQSAITAFSGAIDAAKEIANDTSVTQARVDQAVTDLTAAETIFETSRVTIRDQTPPSSVTNLQPADVGINWIRWIWTNPTDVDFSHVAIYLNGTFVTNTFNDSINFYNATGLAGGTTYTIGIHTVDIAGNVDPTGVNSSATTDLEPDNVPPANVTSLNATNIGHDWIRWTWINPDDPDLSHITVHINGIFVTNISNTSTNFYNATGLEKGTMYTIGLRTVDTSGNINPAEMSSSATTLKLPEILRLSGTNITTSSITLMWEASNDTTSVQIQRNNFILEHVNGSAFYVDDNLNASTTYRYVLIPFNENGLAGEAVTISLRTASSHSSESSSGEGNKKKSTVSGGAGSSVSTEDFDNIAMKEAVTRYLKKDSYTMYEFKEAGNVIHSIGFYPLKNLGSMTSIVEILNSRSKIVNSSPNGLIYKYVNIWVGGPDLATSGNIKDAKVKFKVNNSWIQEMDIDHENVKLQRYNGMEWEELPTIFVNSTEDHTLFESKTSGFSAFAITAEKKLVSISEYIDAGAQHVENKTYSTDNSDFDETRDRKTNTKLYPMGLIMIGVIAGVYMYLKRQ